MIFISIDMARAESVVAIEQCLSLIEFASTLLCNIDFHSVYANLWPIKEVKDSKHRTDREREKNSMNTHTKRVSESQLRSTGIY